MWQVTNIKEGWKTGGGNATKLRCSTKTATGSGKQATIDVNIEPEQQKECMTALKMIPTTAVSNLVDPWYPPADVKMMF